MTFIAGRMYFYTNLIFFVIVCSVHHVGFDVWKILSSCQNKFRESAFKKVESFYCVTFDFPSSLFSVWAYLTWWQWSLFMSPKNIRKSGFLMFLGGIERDQWHQMGQYVSPQTLKLLHFLQQTILKTNIHLEIIQELTHPFPIHPFSTHWK